jgi:hypothetical protein
MSLRMLKITIQMETARKKAKTGVQATTSFPSPTLIKVSESNF